LVVGVGDGDNGLFTIVGDQVQTAAALDFETLGSPLNIRIETTDSGTGNLTYSEAMTVTLTDLNEVPVLDPIGDQSVDELTLLSFTATASDSDVPADTLTFSLQGVPPAGATITGGGDFTWTPSEAQGPGVYPVTVRVTDDGTGLLFDEETFNVTVNDVNEVPVLDPIGDQSVDELTLLSFTATASDSDIPADTLSYSLVGAPAGAALDPSTGAFSWTPTEAQGPGAFVFDVVVTDLFGQVDSETITVTVAETNLAPSIVNPGSQVGGEGASSTLALIGTDGDEPVNVLTWSAIGLPDGLTIDAATGSIIGVVSVGAAVDSPYAVTVDLTDDGTPALSGTVTFSWVITENTPPVTGPDFYEVAAGGTLSVGAPGVLSNDGDPDGDAIIATLVVPPSAGTLTFPGNGSFTYVHNGGATVEDVFVYQVGDGRGGLTLATVKISVLEPNLPPILNGDFLTVLEDGFGSLAPLANDSDPNGDSLTLVEFSQPDLGSLVAGVDGTLLYTPPADFFGEVTASYTAADGNGGLAIGTIAIVVESVNDLPVGRRDVVTLTDYLPFVINVLANDGDIDGDRLRVTDVLGITAGVVVVNPDGTVTYRPTAGFVGTDAFSYLVADDVGGVDTVAVSVTIPAQVLAAAIARAETIGSPNLGFQAPPADLNEGPSLRLGFSQGVSLLADAFFQSLGALRLPILFLGLALGTVVVLGGFTELPLLMANRRRRYYSVVLLDREHRLPVNQSRDLNADVAFYYEPTAAGFQSLDKPVTEGGRRWIPVESPSGAGWVDAAYVTEAVDLQFFLDDDRPVEMLQRLAAGIVGRTDLSPLFSDRGFAIALTNEPEMIPVQAFRKALADRHTTPGASHLWDNVLEPLGEALRATEDVDSRGSHSQTALIPVELWNFQYLAVNAPGHPPWLVYFEYQKGKPKIVGIGMDV
jgi:hypothetical protein